MIKLFEEFEEEYRTLDIKINKLADKIERLIRSTISPTQNIPKYISTHNIGSVNKMWRIQDIIGLYLLRNTLELSIIDIGDLNEFKIRDYIVYEIEKYFKIEREANSIYVLLSGNVYNLDKIEISKDNHEVWLNSKKFGL